MDRIEELMSAADPAGREGAGGPGPLELGEPIPLIVERTAPLGADSGRRGRRALWWTAGGLAAAAAVVAATVLNPFGTGMPEPAPPAGPSPTKSGTPTDSTAPSDPAPSGAATDPPDEPTAPELPNGLLPAHANVRWDDSQACRSLDVGTVLIAPVTGDAPPAPLGGEPDVNRAVGCVGDHAAFTVFTDLAHFDADHGDTFAGLYLASWDGERWSVDHSGTDGEGTETYQEVATFPSMRLFGDPDGRTAREQADAVLDSFGIEIDDPESLLGPNTATWAPDEPQGDWTGLDTGPSGFSAEHRSDWEVREADPEGAPSQRLVFFDRYGAQTATLERFSEDPSAGGTCEPGQETYRIHASEAVSATDDAGSLEVALMTGTNAVGSWSFVGLVRAGQPAEGALCEVDRLLEVDGTFVVAQGMSARLGFESDAELGAYLESQSWADTVRFARSLRFS